MAEVGAMVHIGLEAWIIQSGPYSEFEAGREYRFALEFSPRSLAVSAGAGSAPSLAHRGHALYDAHGEIVFRTESVWVVDFGVVPAFQEVTPPDWARTGQWVSGSLCLGVDPYFYFERLKSEKGMPNLFRDWFIRRILLETTPRIESIDRDGRKVIARDTSRESFVEVPATDSWHHDGGHGYYVFECELRSKPAA